MQTFLPLPDFAESAKVLDYRRLGKQRVEVLQLLNALRSGEYSQTWQDKPRKTPWYNHPAAKMWRGYENALVSYGLSICTEWLGRGYKDTCYTKILGYWNEGSDDVQPAWIGDPGFHASHRSNLLRKDATYYGQFGWKESSDLPYIWPSNA